MSDQTSVLSALRANMSLLGELALRYDVDRQPDRPSDEMVTISCPEDTYDLLASEMVPLVQEQLRVLLLDTRYNLRGQRVIYQGNVNSSMVRPAEVFRPAIIDAATAIIVAHNHPSGDPMPSDSDIRITRDLVDVGKLLGIELLDHMVICGGGVWRSLKRDRGDLFATSVRAAQDGMAHETRCSPPPVD